MQRLYELYGLDSASEEQKGVGAYA
jgi:hypothetical protein